MLLKLIDQFQHEGKTGFKLIKIQLCEVKIYVIRVGPTIPATPKMELLVLIVEEWKLSKIFTKNPILDVTAVLDSA